MGFTIELGSQTTANKGQLFLVKLGYGVLRGGRNLREEIVDDSYTFCNKYWDVTCLGGWSFRLDKIDINPTLGFGFIGSNAEGHFLDSSDARNYYRVWGDKYFTAVDVNGDITHDLDYVDDVYINYKGVDIKAVAGLHFVYRVSERWQLGLQVETNLVLTDDLDAFSFPIWRNTSNWDRYSKFLLAAYISI